MKIVILGGGPAGLYCGLLIKKAHPAHEITLIERNPADVTYGWGVVFSDNTLASFQRADYRTYEQITEQFVIWNAIDTFYRGEKFTCGGHVIASIARKALLNILQRRCVELGVTLVFGRDIHDLTELGEYDLLIAADGVNSLARRTYADSFKPHIDYGKARYIWLGANRVLDAFTFIFSENEHGLFQVHAYPFNGTISTFIVECDEATWLNAGLDTATEQYSISYCQQLFAAYLGDAKLLSNNSKWLSFPTLKTQRWHRGNIVLLGDAVHTAHFSIGSGTKLAMEDAISLTQALEQHIDIPAALNAYEMGRKPVVEVFQRAAAESQAYFETNKRHLSLHPMPFTFQLLTRSGRITYNDLKFRDARFGDAVDRWWAEQSPSLPYDAEHEAVRHMVCIPRQLSPPPMFTSFTARSAVFPNRLVAAPFIKGIAQEGAAGLSTITGQYGSLTEETWQTLLLAAQRVAGLILAKPVAVAADGRITPEDAGIYSQAQQVSWLQLARAAHDFSTSLVAIELNHAGRRGSTRPRTEGLDRPLRDHNWPLLSASAIPYSPRSQTPRAMDRHDMDEITGGFVRAALMARDAGFDLLQINMAHGYLLASFLSPLTNRRDDDYGGDLPNRLRYPLEVFDAVRAAWTQDKPLSVALNVTDCVKDGFDIEDAVIVASALKERGCDIIQVLAGQTTIDTEPIYGRGFLTPFSERIRNEARIPTLVGGYLTTSDEVNTIIAAGRADLCIVESQVM